MTDIEAKTETTKPAENTKAIKALKSRNFLELFSWLSLLVGLGMAFYSIVNAMIGSDSYLSKDAKHALFVTHLSNFIYFLAVGIFTFVLLNVVIAIYDKLYLKKE